MKTYIVTEKDLERLQETFPINDDSWWYNARVDEWIETLSYKTDNPYDDLQREVDNLKKILDDSI